MITDISQIVLITSLKQTATANYFINAFRSGGYKVIVCSDVPGEKVDHIAYGAVDISELVLRFGVEPDLVLFIEGGTMQLFPVGLEKLSCMTAWYGIDTHMDYAKHLRIGRVFDVTFVAQKEYVESLRADGIKQVHWLPLAFAPELLPVEAQERCYDVAYVGSDNAVMHPERHALLVAIKQMVCNVFAGTASPVEMGQIYSQAKIVFNKSVNNDVNMRYFEAMGCGAVFVTDPIHDNGVDDLFIRGTHFFEYTSENSLLQLIEVLRNDSDRCNKIGQTSQQYILQNHTYAHRVKALLDITSANKKMAKPTSGDYFSALLTLVIMDGALKMVAQSFVLPGNAKNRMYGTPIRSTLMLLAYMVGFGESCLRLFRLCMCNIRK